MPSSSLTAVVTKSTGICRDHWAIVLGGTSGEEKSTAQHERQHGDDADRDAQLLDEVVGPVGPVVVARRRVQLGVREPPCASHRLGAAAPLRGGDAELARSGSGGTTPWRRTSRMWATTSATTTTGSSSTW